MKKVMFCVFTVSLALVSRANLNRGVWFWYSSTSPYGSSNIVGSAVLESQTVSFLKSRGVKRIYGSYKNRSIDEPAVIAAWNERLHLKGIQSQFLFAEPTWVEVANRPNLLAKITSRVINFNTSPGRTAAEKFDAVHLDLEPQQLAAWDAGSPAVKRNYLSLLLDTYTEVRAHLDAAGQYGTGVYADLPVWFDKLPVDGGSVGWADAADRDGWYAAIGVPLSGISMMAFERDSFSSIDNAVAYERANIPGATVRTAIQAKVGTGETWADIGEFKSMMDTLETAYGFSGATDIENYRLWREVVAAQPITAVAAAFSAYTLNLGFGTTTGGTYVIQHSINLCNWQEIKRVRAQQINSITNLPVSLDEDRGFWKIYRFEDFQGP